MMDLTSDNDVDVSLKEGLWMVSETQRSMPLVPEVVVMKDRSRVVMSAM
jgi:hypothetical protein